MTPDSPATSLELEQDAGTRRREWRFERAGWVALALVLGAALAGAFGDGPLARAHTAAPGGTSADYDRVVHYGASSAISLTLPRAVAGDTIAELTLDRGLLERADVERVTPDPLETRASSAVLQYHLRRTAAEAPMRVDVTIKATAIGWRDARFDTPGGPVVVRQFVLP